MKLLSNSKLSSTFGGQKAPSPGSWTPWNLLYEIGQDLGHHLGHWWYGNEEDHKFG